MNENNWKFINRLDNYDKELINQILELKRTQKVLILAHYYQYEPIQLIADVLGDSLELARAAQKEIDAKYILFCGVKFMAETASILNPQKTVLFPEKDATCSMAEYATPKILSKYKSEHPDIPIIMYINSTAEAKFYADVICTSSNALHIVKSTIDEYKAPKFAFSPDKHLGTYISKKINVPVDIIPSNGNCYVHNFYSKEDVDKLRRQYPDHKLLVHPESPWEVAEKADFVGSTSKIIQYAKEHSDEKGFIIGTENGIVNLLRRELPEKSIIPLSEKSVCRSMKRTTLENVLKALKNPNSEKFIINVESKTAEKARKSIEKMMELSKSIK